MCHSYGELLHLRRVHVLRIVKSVLDLFFLSMPVHCSWASTNLSVSRCDMPRDSSSCRAV